MRTFSLMRWRPLAHLLGVLIIVGTLLPLLPPTSLRAATNEWPQYRHDARRTGRADAAPALGSDGKLHLQWAYSLGERVETEVEPIVANGRVYVGSMNGTMSALAIADGSLAWSFTASGPIAHTAAYANSRLFFGSLDGSVYAINDTNGQQVWRYPTGGPVYAAPTLNSDGSTLYIGSTSGRIVALNTTDGSLRWSYPSATQAALSTPFTGAVALSPDESRLYTGNEDRMARAINTSTGALSWSQQLLGTGMRTTFPIVSDNGNTVIFQVTKPGVQSYLPTENYPAVAAGNNPVSTWNTYYQTYPERRSLFFLNASTGQELWNAGTSRYVPLPIPYWGLLAPVLDSSGNAWFPAAGGAQGSGFGNYELDHDTRLIRMNLSDGSATETAVRSDFQQRMDENGRATFAGDHYMTAISEDVGTFNTATKAKTTLFGNPNAGFQSHMDPLAPLPSKHLWRYGGTIAMGGVPGASPPIVAGDRVYYISYGWLYVLGPNNSGKDPTGTAPIAFTSRDTRRTTLTYPRSDLPTAAQLRTELDQRMNDLINAPSDPFPYAKFDQPFGLMTEEVSGFQVFGLLGERMWILSRVLPQLSPSMQAKARTYLQTLAQNSLFKAGVYRHDCLIWGVSGLQTSDQTCANAPIAATWFNDNELLMGEQLYAMAAYSEVMNDWSLVDANWTLIKSQFSKFTSAYNASLGFCVFQKWHVGKLGIASQIGAAAGVLRMATHRNDTTVISQAQTLLNNLLSTRSTLANYAQTLYDKGTLQPLTLRIDADGVPNKDDIFQGYNDPGELIPLEGDRTRTSDTRQVNWSDGTTILTHSTTGFMHAQALVGYSPLYPELTNYLRNNLLDKTRRYVQTFEVNGPWWWMSDLTHHTTAGGEHLWNSPTLSHDLFQVKARVLQEDWATLAHQLPIPMSINPRYDLYRMDNLATLLELSVSDLSLSSIETTTPVRRQGQRAEVGLYIRNIGSPLATPVTATVTLPSGLNYVAGSGSATTGTITPQGNTVIWNGIPSTNPEVQIHFSADVTTSVRQVVTITVQISTGIGPPFTRQVQIIFNGINVFLASIGR